jgi:hypothetical protein
MDGSTEPAPLPETGRVAERDVPADAHAAGRSRPSRRRLLGTALAMMIAWLATDAILETLNQATGIVRLAGPASFAIGPLAGIGVGWAAGLRARGDWVRALPLAAGGGVLVVALALIIAGRMAPTGPGPDFETLDFGVGGDGCDLARSARVFSPTDPVVAAARFAPAISRGSTITIRMTHDGTMVADYPVVQVADEPWPCVYGAVEAPPLAPGEYRWSIEVSGSAMPPLAGEFTVGG